eukprot:gene3955-7211_t
MSDTSKVQAKFSVISVNDVYEISKDEDGVGGLAELCTIIKQEKGKNCFVTLNGDFLSASMLAAKFKGSHMIDIFNTIPFTYLTLGNHEFDFGTKILLERIAETRKDIKYINSNIRHSDTHQILKGTFEKDIIILENNLKIGVFAVCTTDTTQLSTPGKDCYFEDVLTVSNKMVKELKEFDKVDCVIALTHLTITEDRELAANVPGIDFMLGGHDHSPHTQYQGECLIHKSGMDAQFVSKFDMILEKKITAFNGKTYIKNKLFPSWKMILNKDIEGDKETAAVVKKYLEFLPKDSGEVIGLVIKRLNSQKDSVRSKETNMANLFCDALKDVFNADIGFVSGGAVRGDSFYNPGVKMTKGDIDKESPFPNQCKIVQITGKMLLESVEFGISKLGEIVGSYPHFSHGISIEYNKKNPIGSRVTKALFNQKPIKNDDVFTIASTSYLLNGGDGYLSWKYNKPVENELNDKIILHD